MKDKKKMLVILGAVFAILMIGGTYAWLRITVDIKTTHTIHAGKLDLVLDDDASSGINIEKAVPTSDKKGVEQEGYTFKLINRGTIDSNYTLYLDDLSLNPGEERMKDKIVKYSLERETEGIDGTKIENSGLLPEMGSNPNRILDKGIIAKNTTYIYTLKVWMSKDATIEDMGSVFFAKIRAEAEQTNIPVTKSDLELTPASKEKVPIKEGEDPRKYTYTSSDWNVVKVDEDGNIEVIGPGTAVITKTDPTGGGKEEITVHVTVPIKPEFATNDKIASIGNTTGIGCSLTKNNQTTCKIDLPEVIVKDGYEFVGWSTTEGDHEGRKDNIEVSAENNVLYPIVKIPGKQLTASIVKQGDGVEGIETENVTCDIKDAYNNEEPSTSCEITLPDITAKEGYEVIGWSTDSGATTGLAPGSKVEISTDITYYTIYKKKAKTLTATFMLNGAKSLNGKPANQLEAGGALKLTCTIEESYGGSATGESCEITVPIIEASDATPIVIGFNEDKEATAPSISGDTIRISENKMYYALTKSEVKTYTATFHRNNAAKIDGKTDDTVTRNCNIGITYNGTPQAEGCTPDGGVPSIEGSTNTPTVLGYSTKSGYDDKAEYLETTDSLYLTGDVVYYAQTANNDNITYTATYKKGSNVINIVGGKESDVCHVPASYNGESRATSCTVEAPDYTVDEGYKKVGYSEEKDAKDGVLNTITLTKDTELYANAAKTSITIEYYQDGEDEEPTGTSNAGVGESIALKDSEELGIEKKGYSFKGWKDAENKTYESGDIISGLAEGTTMKLYAVWMDDIAPVCTLNGLKDSYIVGEKFDVTLTCSDDGSGLVEPSETVQILTRRLIVDDRENTFNYKVFTRNSSSCDYQNGVLTCNYELETTGTTFYSNGDVIWNSFTILLNEGVVFDQNGNSNQALDWGPKAYGKTFTATPTATQGIKTMDSTAESCTTQFDNKSCNVRLSPDTIAKDSYRWAGWSSNTELINETRGDYTFTLTEDTTFYPVVGPIFVDAYVYDETKVNPTDENDNSRVCVTGEESTCKVSECYKDEQGPCAPGTIFKYAVKSDVSEFHLVDSLDDHVYYFYTVEDKGATITMQSREDVNGYVKWADNLADGPTAAIEYLEEQTKDWEYVDTQTYTMGTIVFGNSNVNTGFGNYSADTKCSWNDQTKVYNCNKDNKSGDYSWDERSAKARLITAQEALSVGCTAINGNCPIWMFNYLAGSINQGGTNNASGHSFYHLMNASTTGHSMFIMESRITHNRYLDNRNVRPVIELDKSRLANWKSAD